MNEYLIKVMQPEIYRGIALKNVLGRWQYGIKSFETKGALKGFIDKIKNEQLLTAHKK